MDLPGGLVPGGAVVPRQLEVEAPWHRGPHLLPGGRAPHHRLPRRVGQAGPVGRRHPAGVEAVEQHAVVLGVAAVGLLLGEGGGEHSGEGAQEGRDPVGGEGGVGGRQGEPGLEAGLQPEAGGHREEAGEQPQHRRGPGGQLGGSGLCKLARDKEGRRKGCHRGHGEGPCGDPSSQEGALEQLPPVRVPRGQGHLRGERVTLE